MTDNQTPDHDVTDGRYLYCLVQNPDGATLDIRGIEENKVHIIEAGEIGAVVHDCPRLYDSADIDQIESWLLTHQEVIDTVAKQFGTPLPFQFDVILEGGDEQVLTWLENNSERISRLLAEFEDLWEYRVHVLQERSVLEEELTQADSRLQELKNQQAQSSEGEAFLVEKQYDQRLQEVVHNHRNELTDDLLTDLDTIGAQVEEQSAEPDAQILTNDTTDDKSWLARIAVLADQTTETQIGDRLDGLADKPGIEVRFTGPWPPYSFTPSLDASTDHETDKK
jgi:hypothetical protein